MGHVLHSPPPLCVPKTRVLRSFCVLLSVLCSLRSPLYSLTSALCVRSAAFFSLFSENLKLIGEGVGVYVFAIFKGVGCMSLYLFAFSESDRGRGRVKGIIVFYCLKNF